MKGRFKCARWVTDAYYIIGEDGNRYDVYPMREPDIEDLGPVEFEPVYMPNGVPLSADKIIRYGE